MTKRAEGGRYAVSMIGRPNRYRSKVVEVDAMEWDGSTAAAYAIEIWSSGACERRGQPLAIVIATSEGWLRVDPDDYIVKGSNGQFYPLKPHIFERQFEPVGEDPNA